MENLFESEKDIIDKLLFLKKEFDLHHKIEKILVNGEVFFIVAYEYNFLTGKIRWEGATESVLNREFDKFNNTNINEWKELIHPEDLSLIGNYPKLDIDGFKLFTINYRIKSENGEFINLKDVGIEFLDNEGNAKNEFGILYRLY